MRNIRETMRAEVDAIRAASGDTVALSDVGSIVESLVATLQGDISATTTEVGGELKELVRYIEGVKSELATIQPESIHGEHIPSATGQLDAILESTAEAADTILDAAEAIEAIADDSPQDVATKLREVSTNIFQASSFQDLNGQRITKVTNSLQEIEVKVISLLRALGYLDSVQPAASSNPATATSAGDENLLNGPAMPGKGNTQDDIDALMASFD